MNEGKWPSQRIAIFIDVQNLYHSAKNLFGKKVNFKEILKTIVGKRKLIRAFAYVVKTKSGEEKSFFGALESLGIEVRIKDLQIFLGGVKKADWDVGLAVDAIRMEKNVDVICLVSGDGDFFPLVEFLKNQGKRVEVYAFSSTTSSKLKEIADFFFDFESQPSKFLLKKNKKHEV